MFGPAQIAVTREEYEWMQRFLKIRRRLPGGSTAQYFFFTSTPNVCKKLVTYFRSAWKAMGLPGSPNFTDIRTSIASHAKFTHSEDNRMKIAKFMCHDVQTADRFYVTNLSVKQAVEHRMLFEAALKGEDDSTAGVKRVRPGRKTDKPRKRLKASEEASGDTSGSPEMSPETSQGKEGLSEGDAQGQSGEGSQEGSPVPSPKKTPIVVIPPLRSKRKTLRPRRISPIRVEKGKEGLSEGDAPGQSGEGSATSRQEGLPVPSPKNTTTVVISPLQSIRNKLRPRRISPINVEKVKKMAQLKNVNEKVRRAIRKRRVKN
ncbi:uncharacterized protein LOC127657771 isoform X1 [Xyrauchen texanus]|uniref:uncharacterized protein LOC127657771 isoform X1 n=1 Tax=Xyrauchen texanus TaxID=154827 RepID=UPI002241E5B8|nr:uncharacterized protein LOC127657771 isoform X1 [Xyrauchen texanus]